MPTYQAEQVTTSGITPTPRSANAGGDKVSPDSLVRVINGSGSSVICTMVTPEVFDGDLAIADRTITIAAGAAKVFRASKAYRSRADQLVSLTWSAVTTVTFEVIA